HCSPDNLFPARQFFHHPPQSESSSYQFLLWETYIYFIFAFRGCSRIRITAKQTAAPIRTVTAIGMVTATISSRDGNSARVRSVPPTMDTQTNSQSGVSGI